MARSFVWDGTDWIKEDEILPLATEASNISYDNTESGLEAATVQDAIDEVVNDVIGDVDTAISAINALIGGASE